MSTNGVEPARVHDPDALLTTRFGYVPALDGLRAVAVIAVLLFHGDVSAAHGGFLGVSVFFTLSGFLITSLLLREWAAAPEQRLDLRGFFGRRFRRLLPASWFTIAVVLTMGALSVWDTEQLRDLRSDVPWSLAEALNWHFIASGTTYGASQSAPSPLEHFWSLAVEQQFYLLLPVLLTVVLIRSGRLAPQRRVRLLVGVLAVLTVASATANGLLARGSIDRAYFGTDTRAAELLIGALLACVALRRTKLDGPGRPAVSSAGFVGVAGLVLLFHVADLSSAWLYPWGLLATAMCTAAVIAGSLQGGVLPGVLSLAPLIALGRISYGVYLLHWPIFLWLTPARTGTDGPLLFTIRVAASIAAAALMFRVVESPLRAPSPVLKARLRFAAPIAAVLILSGTAVVTRSLPDRPDYLVERDADHVEITEAAPTTTTAAELPASTVPPAPASLPTPDVVPTEAPPTAPEPVVVPRRPARVLLVGDSIAVSLEAALRTELTGRGITFATAAAPGCGVITGTPTDQAGAIVDFTAPCNDAIPGHQRRAVSSARPDLVVALSTWETVDRVVDGIWYVLETPEGSATTGRLLGETAERLGAEGAAVAFVTMPDVVDGRNRVEDPWTNRRQRIVNSLNDEVAAARPGRVTTLPFDRFVCPAVPCPTEVGGTVLRPADGAHFDDPAGARVAAVALADMIAGLDLDRL